MHELPYEKRWEWTTSETGKHVNELQTMNSLCTVSIVLTVLSVSTVVSNGFHTFQLLLCCALTDKTATAVLAQGSNPCVIKTQQYEGCHVKVASIKDTYLHRNPVWIELRDFYLEQRVCVDSEGSWMSEAGRLSSPEKVYCWSSLADRTAIRGMTAIAASQGQWPPPMPEKMPGNTHHCNMLWEEQQILHTKIRGTSCSLY